MEVYTSDKKGLKMKGLVCFMLNKGYHIKDLCEVSVFCVLYNLKLDTYGDLCKITDYRNRRTQTNILGDMAAVRLSRIFG